MVDNGGNQGKPMAQKKIAICLVGVLRQAPTKGRNRRGHEMDHQHGMAEEAGTMSVKYLTQAMPSLNCPSFVLPCRRLPHPPAGANHRDDVGKEGEPQQSISVSATGAGPGR